MVEAMEDLSLHRVKKLESASIYLFEQRVLEGGYRERLQIKQVGVDALRIRPDEMLKGDWRNSFSTQPAV
jgi:hypothetical protein